MEMMPYDEAAKIKDRVMACLGISAHDIILDGPTLEHNAEGMQMPSEAAASFKYPTLNTRKFQEQTNSVEKYIAGVSEMGPLETEKMEEVAKSRADQRKVTV